MSRMITGSNRVVMGSTLTVLSLAVEKTSSLIASTATPLTGPAWARGHVTVGGRRHKT